jgi:hypothetical protein
MWPRNCLEVCCSLALGKTGGEEGDHMRCSGTVTMMRQLFSPARGGVGSGEGPTGASEGCAPEIAPNSWLRHGDFAKHLKAEKL